MCRPPWRPHGGKAGGLPSGSLTTPVSGAESSTLLVSAPAGVRAVAARALAHAVPPSGGHLIVVTVTARRSAAIHFSVCGRRIQPVPRPEHIGGNAPGSSSAIWDPLWPSKGEFCWASSKIVFAVRFTSHHGSPSSHPFLHPIRSFSANLTRRLSPSRVCHPLADPG